MRHLKVELNTLVDPTIVD